MSTPRKIPDRVVKPINVDKYRAMVEAARGLDPADKRAFFKALAAAGRVKLVTAEQAWRKGWPDAGMPSIRQIFMEESMPLGAARFLHGDETPTQRRAEEARIEASVRERLDIFNARTEEFRLVRYTRLFGLELLQESRDLMHAFKDVLDAVATRLPDLVRDISQGPMTLSKLDRISGITEKFGRNYARYASALLDVIRAERLLVGQATEITETTTVSVEMKDVRIDATASATDIMERLRVDLEAIERIRRRELEAEDGAEPEKVLAH